MAKKDRYRPFRQTILVLFFVFTSGLYLHNLTQDIYSGDIGDIVTAAYVFGIAHPPGYPLLVSLSSLFIHLPFPIAPVAKAGLVSIIASLVGLFFFYKLSLKASKSFLIALLSTAVLAFSYLFWFYTEVPEVFALNNLFIILLFYLAYRFNETKKYKYFYLLAFFGGLSMTNQHQIIALFPALLLLIIINIKRIWQRKRSLLYGFGFFLLGFFPYLYVPLMASQQPVINWDNVTNFKNFLHMFLRLDYMTFKPGVLNLYQRLPILNVYTSTLINNFSLLIVFICLLGIPKLYKASKTLFVTYLFAFIVSGPLFIYTIVTFIKDSETLAVIERFYIESFIVFLFLLPYGLHVFQSFFEKIMPRKIYAKLCLLILFIVPVMMVIYNFPKNDLSKTHIGNNLGYDILSQLPKNAYLFPHSDSGVFNTWYVHYVLGYRPDVTIIHLREPVNTVFDQTFAKEYYKKNPKKKDVDNGEILEKTLPEIIKKHPVFATYGMSAPQGMIALPLGVVYQIINVKDIPPKEKYLQQIDKNIRHLHVPIRDQLALSDQNLIAPNISRFYSNSFISIGNFIDRVYDDPKQAKKYFVLAAKVDDENSLAYASLAIVQWELHENCSYSQQNMEKAIYYHPHYKLYYVNLYNMYNKCKVEKSKISNLKKKYQSLFGKTLEKETAKSISESEL